ncbi:MAG: hypothetical protein IJW82_04755, partial [Clostridia bacterium]|nr:hypothetical protein [Clostridia bacterium]
CDHDTIDGSKKVFELLNKDNPLGFIFHSGVELSCIFNDGNKGINMHILVYDFDYNDKNILEVVNEISLLRKQKVSIMVDFVEKNYNVSIPTNLLQKKLNSTKSFGKPHLYSILSQIGNYDREEYYRIMDNLPTKNLKLDTKKTLLKLINSGKTVLAHPIEIMKEYNINVSQLENLITTLKDFGLKGIEAYHSSQDLNLQIQLSAIAQKHNLFITKGSDFHGPNIKPNLKIGVIQKE